MLSRAKGKRYDAAFTLKVRKCAIEPNNCNAARVHGVKWKTSEKIAKTTGNDHETYSKNPESQ